MPFFEEGVFYVYYLKDGGDSYNHSVFLATTTDFVSWNEIEKPVLEPSRTLSQDSWIGTGSVVKIDGEYVFFYTGHEASVSEYGEKIMAAKHIEKDGEMYFVGCGRRSEEPALTQEVKGWAGNIVAQKIVQRADGSLFLSPIDAVKSQFTAEKTTLFKNGNAKIFAKAGI